MNQIYLEGFSAFAGAFFAFLFLRIGEFLAKLYERQVRHYNSLVILETQLNELIGIIEDNIYLITPFKQAILSGNIYFSRLSHLPYDTSHYDNLHDISLINDLFAFNYQLRKLNDDTSSLLGGYDIIKNAYIQHDIDRNDYLVNAQITATMLTTIEIFLRDTNQRAISQMSKVRLMSKNDVPLGTKLMRMFIHTSGDSLNKDDIKAETKKLVREINWTKRKSRKEIKKIIRKNDT